MESNLFEAGCNPDEPSHHQSDGQPRGNSLHTQSALRFAEPEVKFFFIATDAVPLFSYPLTICQQVNLPLIRKWKTLFWYVFANRNRIKIASNKVKKIGFRKFCIPSSIQPLSTLSVLRIRIWDPVLVWPLDPNPGWVLIPDPGSTTHISESLVPISKVKNALILNFFSTCSKIRKIYNVVKFLDRKFFYSSLLFCCCLIQDKHPGSASPDVRKRNNITIQGTI